MDLAGRSATELADLVRRKQASPTEIVAAHLARIEALDGRVHAFQVVRAERALAEARALEDRRDLASLPFAGVPVAIKDSVDVAGEPTRHGSAATSNAPAERDDELVRRLRAAGCIIIGKTTLPELSIWAFGSSALAEPRNPWNVSRTTGGSSAGAAAALASGMVPIAQGSDGGGSIRIPSACCGVFGIKPTPGLVPCAGGLESHWFGLSAWGPMATTVADAARMLDVLAGTSTHADPRPPEAPLRIAFSSKSPAVGVTVHADIEQALAAIADALRAARHSVSENDPPYAAHAPLVFLQRFYCGIAEDVESMGLPFERLEARTQQMVKIGRWLTRRRPVRIERSHALRDRMLDWLRDVDVLVTPTFARTAIRGDGWPGTGMAKTLFEMTSFVPFTQQWNIVGFPAASVPVGIASDGLPIGLQVVAPPGREDRILSVCAQLEALRPWRRHAPVATAS